VRSSVFGLEAGRQWLTGSATRRRQYADKFDFRLGLKIQSETKIYVQGRYRKTSSSRTSRCSVSARPSSGRTGSEVRRDHQLRLRSRGAPDFLIRWERRTHLGKVEGLAWRSSLLGYKNLPGSGAFSTDCSCAARAEPTCRARVRRARHLPLLVPAPLAVRELILGYSYPREELEDRAKAPRCRLRHHLWFGEDPW